MARSDSVRATKTVSITPNDSTNIQKNSEDVIVDALWIGGAGDIKMALQHDEDSDAETQSYAAQTWILGLRIRKIFSTGTDATNLVGYF